MEEQKKDDDKKEDSGMMKAVKGDLLRRV